MKASLWFLVALLVAMPVSFLTDPEEFTNNELIRAYCELVKRERFYKYHKLKENCFLYVRIFTEYDQVLQSYRLNCKNGSNSVKLFILAKMA